MNARVVIVPSGGANYGSLVEACRRTGVEAEVSGDAARILGATHVILPGVGAAAHAMRHLRDSGLDRVLRQVTRPLLGICLGMQLLFERSEEGGRPATTPLPRLPTPSGTGVPERAGAVECLGLLRGNVRRLPAAPSWPHMGWNTLRDRVAHPLLAGIGDRDWFYFVHGYAAAVGDGALAASDHGDAFCAVAARGHVLGVQFHPEKSAASGRRLLSNFFALT